MSTTTKSTYDLGLEVESLNSSIGSYEARLNNWFVSKREKKEIIERLPDLKKEFEEKRKEYKKRLASQQAEKTSERV